MIPSMSRLANPYDNASCESFIKTLRWEEIYANEYQNLDALRTNIEAFIEQYYNRQRLHSALGYRPPEEFVSPYNIKAIQAIRRKQMPSNGAVPPQESCQGAAIQEALEGQPDIPFASFQIDSADRYWRRSFREAELCPDANSAVHHAENTLRVRPMEWPSRAVAQSA